MAPTQKLGSEMLYVQEDGNIIVQKKWYNTQLHVKNKINTGFGPLKD